MTDKSLIRLDPTIMDDTSLNEQIKNVKEKILNWLKEEAFSPVEVSDPNAYFNFKIKVNDLDFYAAQNIHYLDSVAIGVDLALSQNQLNLLRNSMDKQKRQEFFWDLRLSLLRNVNLGEFSMKPNPPEDVREIIIFSRRIFYDALTKDDFIFTIWRVYRAVLELGWLLERYAGASTTEESKTTPYT